MLKLKNTFVAILCVFALVSCKKKEASVDIIKVDDKLIVDFIAKNNLKMTKDATYGFYYDKINPGSGVRAVTSSTIVVTYQGRLLDGTIFDQGTAKEFELSKLIDGWQKGIPLIEKGGEIRLLIPSHLAYGYFPPSGSGIPISSVLDFTIQLNDVK